MTMTGDTEVHPILGLRIQCDVFWWRVLSYFLGEGPLNVLVFFVGSDKSMRLEQHMLCVYALQLTWKLTNHMKISPCLQDMFCFVKWLPKNYSITHGHSANITTKSRVFADFSWWKYRLPRFCCLWWCYNHHPISPTGFVPIPRSQCTHWHLCPSPDGPGYVTCASSASYESEKIWETYESKWIKIPSSSPNFQGEH